MSNIGDRAVQEATDRMLRSYRERRDQFYTLASERLRCAGRVPAIVALTAVPADVKARLVTEARTMYAERRSLRDRGPAVEGLSQAMRAWGLHAESDALDAHWIRTRHA